jgi:hypothetical protein
VGNQFLGDRRLVSLSFSKDEMEWITQGVDEGVDLG